MHFNSILIGSGDAPALIAYYTKLFGPPGFDEGGYAGWQFGPGNVTVAAHSEVSGRNAQPGRLIWNLETADVLGEFARLKAAGAIVHREPYTDEGWPPETYVATLEDPDGNYFQLVSPMGPDGPDEGRREA